MEVITIDMTEFDTARAKKLDMTLEQYRQALKDDADKHWCRCEGDPSERCSTYHEDGRRTNQHCVRKHHWHCAKCKKLIQIG